MTTTQGTPTQPSPVDELQRKLSASQEETKEALEQQTAVSEVLATISRSAFDLPTVLQTIAERAASLAQADTAVLHRLDGSDLVATALHGSPLTHKLQIGQRFPVSGPTLSARAVRTLSPHYAEDIRMDPSLPQSGSLTRFAVPIQHNGQALGALIVAHVEAVPFTERQRALVVTFADQAAIAMENVRLFNETREALERQRATADILYTISTSPTTDQPVLDAVATNALRFCGAEDVVVLLVDGDVLARRAHAGNMRVGTMQGGPITRVPLVRETVSGRATLESRTIHVPDIQSSDEFPLGRELGRSLGEHANLAAPLLQQGKAMGAILLRRTDLHPFGDEEVALAEGFAAQAVIAIENVRLFNETKEALERQTATANVLAVISRSAFDIAPVLQTIAESSLALCRADHAVVWQRDGDEWFYDATAGDWAPSAPSRLMRQTWQQPAGPSTVERAIDSRRAVHLPDVLEDPQLRPESGTTETRTRLAVPILRDGDPIGAIQLGRRQMEPFSEREITLVESFATQAAIAIENVRLFHKIQDTSRQLEVANRHKSEFLANMSHELRTPLNAIIGFSDVLIGGMAGPLDGKQTEYLEDIRGSGRHLLSLINDILDLSKVEAGRMELTVSEFSLLAALSNAVTMIRERAAGHGIGLDLSVDGVDLISADERKVKQILFNLLSNAVKFTPDGGTISVRAVRQGNEALVSVCDTGFGIPKQDQGRIFEEFRQSGAASTRSAETEGTGLGLALTKSFVDLHGGRIWVESEVGKGSTFHFTIPLAPPAGPRASAAP